MAGAKLPVVVPEESAETARLTTVYKLFDERGRLLYVGITHRDVTRLKQHSKDKDWWVEVAEAKFEHMDSRAEALWREAFLIRTEKPRYNIALNGPDAKPGFGFPRVAMRSELRSAFDAKVRRLFKMTSENLLTAIQRGEISRRDPRLGEIAVALGIRYVLPPDTPLCIHCDERPREAKVELCRRCRGYQARTGELPSEDVLIKAATAVLERMIEEQMLDRIT